ncbi:MAG: dihydrolipoyl dehydrogenase, partial [Candidatus Eisenbacteria bacterium]|nr:dihydrolipoyl dehydrogenase [Candidatus Eisenbacteria bacterium]
MGGAPFDLVVIGSGPGGYVAAIRAAQLGLRTACVEKYPTLGGTCLNVGCIPSKALLDSSEHFANARDHLEVHGIRAQIELDLSAMMKRKDQVVRDLTRGIEALFKKNGVERVTGAGRIVAPGRVEVTGDAGVRSLETRRILIAAGSKPATLPGIAIDGRRIVHSTHALALPEVPRRLLVIGAGAIGLELGSVWRRLGSDVTVLEFQDGVVPGADRASARSLQRALEKQGLRFRFGCVARAARLERAEVVVTVTEGDAQREERCDVLLVAVGRRPFTDDLGAREAGVEIDERGRVKVDAHYQSRVPGIWAIGDVIEGPMLAHKAEEEGLAAVERMAGLAGHVSYECIPNVVYTWPELAGVGMTEEEAAAAGREIAIGTFPFMASGRARAMNERFLHKCSRPTRRDWRPHGGRSSP